MSASTDILIAAASTVLSGGGVAAFVSVYTAKRKVPVERDAIAVGGAETSVLSLERSLKAETRRADRAAEEVVRLQDVIAERDRRITALEKRLDDMQVALDRARDELHALVSEIHKERP